MMMKNNYDTSNWKAFPLTKLFLVTFGNKFDYNKMVESEDMNIAFVSRTASNNGVKGWVEPVEGIEPYPANLGVVLVRHSYNRKNSIQHKTSQS